MSSKYKEEDLSKVRSLPIAERESKVRIEQFVDPAPPGKGAERAFDGLRDVFPELLGGDSICRVADAMQTARAGGKQIVWLIGAHVLKCGLSLYLNSLMDRGYITAIATSGSATVHDLEIAFFGQTSEDVAVELPKGRFGMSRETAEHFNAACKAGAGKQLGLGEGLGAYIGEKDPPYMRYSVFHGAWERSIPATVHVAMGTDITHQHATFSGAEVGELSMRDFRILTSSVGRMFDGGVVIIFGSAVILPEVFLKAVSIGYNLGHKPNNVTAASFDMIPQYRVRENVLTRPFAGSGKSYALCGHHEIMLPLLYHLLEP